LSLLHKKLAFFFLLFLLTGAVAVHLPLVVFASHQSPALLTVGALKLADAGVLLILALPVTVRHDRLAAVIAADHVGVPLSPDTGLAGQRSVDGMGVALQ